MTVKDYKIRLTEKEHYHPDPLHSYISNFKDCANIFSQQSPIKNEDQTNNDNTN